MDNKGKKALNFSAALLIFLVLLRLAHTASKLESTIIIFVILYIDALHVDHATGVGFEFPLILIRRLASHDAFTTS